MNSPSCFSVNFILLIYMYCTVLFNNSKINLLIEEKVELVDKIILATALNSCVHKIINAPTPSQLDKPLAYCPSSKTKL